jgi:hypothetical protein
MLSNGEVALCCQDHEGIVGVNVRDTPILTAFHSTLFQSMRDVHLDGDISSLDMCKDCFGVHSNGTNWMLKTIPAWSPR